MQKISMILAAVILVACQTKMGTETGNAMSPTSAVTTAVLPTDVTSVACTAAKACNPSADIGACETQLESMKGFPQTLGVADSTGIMTETELIAAILNGTVIGSQSEMGDCQSGLFAIPCSSPLEQDVFDAPTGSYTGILNEISSVPACGQIY